MVTPFMMTPQEMTTHLAQNVREKRLSLNLSQKTLAERSGVSLGSLKKFERTGKISLESLLKLALSLGCLEEFMGLFNKVASEQFATLDDLLEHKTRQRGRK